MIITNLLASLLISMGVATSASPFNLDTKPKEVQNSDTNYFSLLPDRQSYVSSNISYAKLTNITELYKQQTSKEVFYGYNDALRFDATMYVETTTDYNSGEMRITETAPNMWSNLPSQEAYRQTNTMVAMQITPYRYLTDAKTHLYFNLSTLFDIEISTQDPNYNYVYYEGPFYVQYDIFMSIDNEWQQYIDQATWNTAFFNVNTIASLTDGSNAYSYNHDTYTKEVTVTANNTQRQYIVHQNLDMVVIGDKINYIFIMITPYFKVNTNEDIYTYSIKPLWNSWMQSREQGTGNVNNHTFEITGNMLTPVGDYEVVDIPGICFEILTMPFSFVSQAFNLTLFPGTPYQVNISSIFLAILGVLIFIFVLNLFIKRGG